MQKDYILELKIPFDLRKYCIDFLCKCDECSSPAKLRAFASVTELTLVQAYIPLSEKLNWNDLFNDLLRNGKSPSEPLLFDLLDMLARQYQEDWKGPKFKELKEEIRIAFAQSENTDQEKDYQRLAEDAAAGDGRGADEAARRWIEEAGDNLDEVALRVTLAVFNGTTFEVIERAKDELLKMLQELVPPPPPPDPEKPLPAVPHVPLMRRLDEAGAKETE